MAGKYDIGPRIGIEGEREYKQAIAEIVQGQKVMASELQAVSAKFEGQDKSLEAQTARHDVLQRTLYGEREKVEKIREALQNATESFGEADKRTQNWQIALNKAKAQQYKLEHQLDQTSREIEDQTAAMDGADKQTEAFAKESGKAADSASGLGDVVGGLTQKFGIHLPAGITQSLNSMLQIDASSVALVGGLAALAAAIVKVEGKLLDLSKTQAAAADELSTTSAVTGISTKALQEYAYAAELVDVSVDTITSAQTKLIKSMDAARDGTEKNIEAFARLGVSYQNTDGTLRDSDAVFWDVIDALGRMQSGTERDAAAMEILGKSAQDLNPLIEAGSARMKELAKEAENVGYILSDKDVAALTALDDAQQHAEKSNEALQKQIAVAFAPSATTAIEGLTKVVQTFGDALVRSGAVEAFGYILESAVGLVRPLNDIDDASAGLTGTMRGLALVLATIADTMQAIAGLVQIVLGAVTPGQSKWISQGWDRLSSGLGFSGDSYTQRLQTSWTQQDAERSGNTSYYNGTFYGNEDAAMYARWLDEGGGTSYDYWKKYVYGHNAAGTDNWRGGLTWVGENGPEIAYLPQGSQVYSAQESREIASGDTNMTIVVPGGVREMAQVVELVKAQRASNRRGGRVRR